MTGFKYIVTITFSILFSLSSIAQSEKLEAWEVMYENFEKTNAKLLKISSIVNMGEKIRSDVLLKSEWSSAIIYTKDKEFINCIARYNILKDRMEINMSNHIRKLHDNKVYGVIMDGSLFVLMLSSENKYNTSTDYYEVLTQGEFTLVNKYDVNLKSVGSLGLHPNLSAEKRYKIKKELFYCHNGQYAQKLKKGEKNILKILAEHNSEIEAFAEKMDIGFKKEEDLISIFRKYNSLIN